MRRFLIPRYIPLVLLVMLLAVFGTEIKLRAVGWWRGEATYRGRPTGWWAHSIAAAFRERKLRHEQPPERSFWRTALEGLGRFYFGEAGPVMADDPQALPVLFELLEYPEAEDQVRAYALSGLGSIAANGGKEETADLLVRHLEDASPEVRCSSALSLWTMGERLDRAGPLLIEEHLRRAEYRPSYRHNILDRLRRTSPAGSAPVYASALKSPDHDLRKVAVERLGHLASAGPPQDRAVARDGLTAALQDEAPELRAAAAKALARVDVEAVRRQP